jgi:hypothetical protein
MTSRNIAPLLFRNMEHQKKRTLLAVLAAVCWTAGIGEALVGFVGGDTGWYIMAAALFFTGAAFLETRRHTRVPGDTGRVSSPD